MPICKKCLKPFEGPDFRRVCSRSCRYPIEQRFWTKVQKTAGCWIWTANKDKRGYGYFIIRPGQSPKAAPRIAFELTYGPIPNGMGALHHCDNPGCVNPEHLFIGTPKDNMHDMIRKGRRSPLAHTPRKPPIEFVCQHCGKLCAKRAVNLGRGKFCNSKCNALHQKLTAILHQSKIENRLP